MNTKDNALRMAIELIEDLSGGILELNEQGQAILNNCKAALSDAVTLPDVAIALEDRDKLGFAVVEVIGKLDEINEQVEEITLHDVNYFAIPAELWHELQDSLEQMPQRADLFTQHKVKLPHGWVAVPVEPTKNMLLQICANGEDFRDWNNKYKAMLQAAPTCEKEKG